MKTKRFILPAAPSSFLPTRWLLASALLLSASSAAALTPSDAAVTDSGQIQRLMTGTYAELFPGGDAAPGGVRALALEVQDGEHIDRLLVPTSGTWRPEHSPMVLWDSESSTSIVFWLSGTGAAGQNTIEFVSRYGEDWGEVRNARRPEGGPLVFETMPTFFASKDTLSFETETGTVTVSRQVMHVVWRESAGDRLLYLPLVFVDGQYVGWSEVLILSEVLNKSHEAGGEPNTGLAEPLRSLFGVRESEGGLLFAMADAEHGRLGVVAVELLPMELSALADAVRDRILAHQGSLDPDGIESLSDDIRAQIIAVGQTVHLNPAISEYTAVRVSDWLRQSDLTMGLQGLADGARDRTLDVSSSVTAQTVEDPSDPDGMLTELDLGEFLGTPDSGDQLADLVKLDVRKDVEAPIVDAEEVTVLISRDGRGMMLCWTVDDGSGLRYTEHSLRDGWSEPTTLRLNASLTIDRAYELLRRRMP